MTRDARRLRRALRDADARLPLGASIRLSDHRAVLQYDAPMGPLLEIIEGDHSGAPGPALIAAAHRLRMRSRHVERRHALIRRMERRARTPLSQLRHLARLVAEEVGLAPRITAQLAESRAPSWTLLVHPMALAMCVLDGLDRSVGPWAWRQGPGNGRIRDFNYLDDGREIGLVVFTRIMLDPASARKGRGPTLYAALPRRGQPEIRSEYVVPHPLPEAVAAICGGRRLADVVELETTGQADIDEALGRLVIDRAEVNPKSTVFTLAPVAWIPFSPVPDGHAEAARDLVHVA